MNRIFLDNAATTPIDPEVLTAMVEVMQSTFGNPSSIHAEGRKARSLIEAARKTVANALNCSIGEIFFTSGGTEANNMALKNAVRDLGVKRIISSPLEHHCVLHSLEAIAATGAAEVEMVNIDERGHVDLADLRRRLEEQSADTLVSLMHSNNEIGNLLPLQEVADLCGEFGVYFHCDTVQTMGYFPIDLEKTRVSFLSGSAHKFYGPKGVGFVYINNDNHIKPYLDGGAQERNMRGGTENVYGIVGLAKALERAVEEREERRNQMESVKQYMMERLREVYPEVRFNGDPCRSHYKVLSVSFPESPKGDLLLMNLDLAGISASGGSACSSGIDVGSHVVGHLHPDSKRHTIRFSFSHHNTREQVDYVVEKLAAML
ncbi:cysteine desulfurase [Lewinella marina]|uniref:Cysteine desulfurase n=1 Tax=Neolewinella marina TaxID=438751 RepID=A0A2G0CJ22_9BACT|nr:cysteine desulfurase family protein [Neolewinella marina]NJB84947.1 cysteine desulfurase [Neolewinella marina]PHK99900.1 cysteine desulfurase [Neolewinella marina]